MKYWVCAYSEQYAAQASVLKTNVYEHMPEHGLIWHLVQGLFQEASYVRLRATLMLLNEGAEEVIISGADCWLRNPLKLRNTYSDCLFVPHAYSLPLEDQLWTFMRGGVINSDFQVWRQGSQNFLSRMIKAIEMHHAKDNFEAEQAWLPLALSCAGGELIQDSYIGTAYYNFHEREITPETKLIHFSGWRKANPYLFTRYPMTRALTPYEQLVLKEYVDLVEKAE